MASVNEESGNRKEHGRWQTTGVEHDSPLTRVLARLNWKRSGSGYSAQCPAHDDKNPSLTINEAADGTVLLKCHAGCTFAAIVAALGLPESDLFPDQAKTKRARIVDTYDYVDEEGILLYQSVRYNPKNFKQRRPDGKGDWIWDLQGVRLVLYNLPAVVAAEIIFIVEGEKDVETLRAWGLTATCNPMGAGKWRDEYSQSFKGKHVVVLRDNDKPGEEHAHDVTRSLFPVVTSGKGVRLSGLPDKGDVSDWRSAGHTKEELLALVEAAPLWTEEEEQHNTGFSSPGAAQEAPRPLRRVVDAPAPYPIDALLTLGAVTKKIREVIQAPLALCGQSVMAAVALAVQGHADVLIDGRVYPLSEYFLTVGESGERKTAVDREVLAPDRTYEKGLVEQYQLDYASYENDFAAYKKSREEVLKKAKTRLAKKQALDEIGPPPEEPLSPILTTEEPTYEGLIKLLIHGQPSMGLFADEGGRFIGGYGMSEDQQLKTAAGLSDLWDGKRISRVRGGDGAAVLYGRRLAMHLMMQPQVAQRLLGNAVLIDQGLMSRCLVTWPESTAGTRPYRAINLRDDTDFQQYSKRITEILKTPLPLADKKRNELNPRLLPLSSQAKALWIKFHDTVERLLAENQPFAPIRGFANKGPEHALRLAGGLTLYKDLTAKEIPDDYMGAGIDLVQYHLGEAVRLFHSSQTDPDLLLAEKLLTWARGQGEYVGLVDIYQRGPNAIRDTATARRVINILQAHGWFVPVQGGKELDGQFRREVWEVKK